MLDYINYNNFIDISHFIVNLWEGKNWDFNILRKNAIVFCHPDNLDILFSNIKFSSNKYIIITSGSDWPINAQRFSQKPPCIKKWYAINVTYKHEDLIPIPYGLHPDRGNANVLTRDMSWFLINIKRLKSNDKNLKTLYCSWNNITNNMKRVDVLQKLKNNNIEYKWDYPEIPSNIIQEKIKLFKDFKITKEELVNFAHYYDYCEHMSTCKFIVSPEGNGKDCHRTWEALYMGSFPIVIKHFMYDEWCDLPIIQVEDYSKVTYDILYSYLNKEYNYEKIYMKYWKERINSEFNKL